MEPAESVEGMRTFRNYQSGEGKGGKIMRQDQFKIGIKWLNGQLLMFLAGLAFTLSTPSPLGETSIEHGISGSKPGAATTNSTAEHGSTAKVHATSAVELEGAVRR